MFPLHSPSFILHPRVSDSRQPHGAVKRRRLVRAGLRDRGIEPIGHNQIRAHVGPNPARQRTPALEDVARVGRPRQPEPANRIQHQCRRLDGVKHVGDDRRRLRIGRDLERNVVGGNVQAGDGLEKDADIVRGGDELNRVGNRIECVGGIAR